MKQANSDDMEKTRSGPSLNDYTLEVEDILEQTDKRPIIVLPDQSPAVFPASSEVKENVSQEILSEDQHTSEKHNDNHQNGQASNTQEAFPIIELVPFTPEVVPIATQPLTPNNVDKPVRQRKSRALHKDQIPQNRPTRPLLPVSPVIFPSVRTPASVRMLKAQRRKKLLLRYLSRKHMRQGREKEQQVSSRFWLSIFATTSIILFVVLGLAGGGTYMAYHFYTDTKTQYAAQIVDLHNLMLGDNLKMYDRNGTLIGQDMEEGMKTTEPLAQISPFLINATIDTEDRSFWTNQGIDITRIIQSAIDDLRNNRVVAGGSTITQQLIKNLILTKDQSFQRKLQEVALVPDVNNHYSKSDILEMYLNSNNYGETSYGPEAAAMMYFGLDDQGNKSAASQLDLAQATMLAGIPNSPSAYDPLQHPQAAFARMQLVLDAMLNNGDITKIQAQNAIKEAQQPNFFKTSTTFINRAPHFYFFILDQLVQQYHLQNTKQLAMSNMKVYTTLDINLQDKIQKIAQDQIGALAGLNVTNAAEILIDFHTGAIISMLGSIDYYNKAIDGQVNVAMSYRQPGSSFKPYVYVTAFANGISPGQAVADTPLTIHMPGETYSPQDADGKLHGQMTIRCALQNSFNIPAVRTLQYVGIDNAMQTAKNMGITSYEGSPGYSLVLGGLGVRLLDHTSAYGTFANAGVHVPYYGIEKVAFANSGHIDQHQADPGTRVISPQLAYMMTNVLGDNVARSPEFGKCSMLYLFSNSQYDCYAGNPGTIRPSASKTGTTNDFRDNLTMGYTTDYVMGVWAGNDNNTPMHTVLGIIGAAPIWHYGMLAAEEGHAINDFANPGGLQKATVRYPDGLRSTDLFLQSQNPNAAPNNPANSILAPGRAGGPTWCSDYSY